MTLSNLLKICQSIEFQSPHQNLLIFLITVIGVFKTVQWLRLVPPRWRSLGAPLSGKFGWSSWYVGRSRGLLTKQIPNSVKSAVTPANPRGSGWQMRHARVPPTNDHPHTQSASTHVGHHQNTGRRSRTALRIWLTICACKNMRKQLSPQGDRYSLPDQILSMLRKQGELR